MTWPPTYNANKERKDLLLPVKIVLFPLINIVIFIANLQSYFQPKAFGLNKKRKRVY